MTPDLSYVRPRRERENYGKTIDEMEKQIYASKYIYILNYLVRQVITAV